MSITRRFGQHRAFICRIIQHLTKSRTYAVAPANEGSRDMQTNVAWSTIMRYYYLVITIMHARKTITRHESMNIPYRADRMPVGKCSSSKEATHRNSIQVLKMKNYQFFTQRHAHSSQQDNAISLNLSFCWSAASNYPFTLEWHVICDRVHVCNLWFNHNVRLSFPFHCDCFRTRAQRQLTILITYSHMRVDECFFFTDFGPLLAQRAVLLRTLYCNARTRAINDINLPRRCVIPVRLNPNLNWLWSQRT